MWETFEGFPTRRQVDQMPRRGFTKPLPEDAGSPYTSPLKHAIQVNVAEGNLIEVLSLHANLGALGHSW